MSILLFTEINDQGQRKRFHGNNATLPSEFDAKAKSMAVARVPMNIYEGQNYTGTYVTIIQAGGCRNLATCLPQFGNWSNRIRSVAFYANSAALIEPVSPSFRDGEIVFDQKKNHISLRNASSFDLEIDVYDVLEKRIVMSKLVVEEGQEARISLSRDSENGVSDAIVHERIRGEEGWAHASHFTVLQENDVRLVGSNIS